MRRALLAALMLPMAALAAISYQTSDLGVILRQGNIQLSTHPTEAECIEAAKAIPVSQSTTFECSKGTQITATYTADPPPADADGDGVLDAADQCPTEPGPAPLGCPVVSTATKFVSTAGSATSCAATAPCSLQRAADISVAGDVILVAPGSYGPLNLTRSGTLTQPIEFRASGAVIENPNGYGIYLKRVSHVTLDGFRIQNTKLKAIASREASATAPVRGLTIRNCTIQNSRQEGMYLSQVADSLIEGNTITEVGLDGVETTGHGIYLANAGSDGTTIRRNVIMVGSSHGAALHINGDLSQGGDGIISNLTIEQNVLAGGIKGISGDGLQTSRIANNVIYDSSQHGIRVYRIDAAQGPKALVVVNNTVRTRTCASCSALKLSSDAGPSVAFNNILVSPDQLYGNLTQSKNLRTWAVDAQYYPLASAKDQGVATFSGQSAPTTDMAGTVRASPPSIGAFE